MKMTVDRLPTRRSRHLLAISLLLAMPALAPARSTTPTTSPHAHGATHAPSPAVPAEPASGADQHAMHGMKPAAPEQAADHAYTHQPSSDPGPAKNHDGMPGVDHSTHGMSSTTAPAMDHGAMHGTPPADGTATSAEPMPHGHGGAAVKGARSPDYSDGIGPGKMPGMHMIDNRPLGMLRVDQLEAIHGRDVNGQAWEVQGWYGNDNDKLWLRSEGERHDGRVEDAEVELLWNHAIAPFWDTQLGVRQDLGDGPQRRWAAFGIQGLAPYWFELQATAYLGPSGRTAARVRAEYELLFTQRLILQPEVELNLHGRDDPATRTGRGLSDATLGLRLRYEIRREFAPYIGVVWIHRFGTGADYARQVGERATDRQFVAGVRFWF